jgi:hypothetical protein
MYVCSPLMGRLALLTFGAQTNATNSHRPFTLTSSKMAFNIANKLEAANLGIKKLYRRLPTLNTFCNAIAGVTAVAVITGKITSLVVDYTTDTALGFCCAYALLGKDGAVSRKLVVFLLWEVCRAVQWYKVCCQRT